MKSDFVPPIESHSTDNFTSSLKPVSGSRFAAVPVSHKVARYAGIVALLAVLGGGEVLAQTLLPFEISNRHNLKWSAEQASRIYFSACSLAARRIRPEKPPALHPRFLLVLGTQENEVVRNGQVSEIRLKSWNAANFAQAVVLMASREILDGGDVASIARDALLSANATVSVGELEQER